ncbi:unnamed protein product [Blumeria hordei]|uniref:Exocyst complex component EXO84 n=2 Tax=Blumeria hordei TaxID=2867405 RepID=A0A383UH54_BLUHO|nr:exocyst complex protein exo84 [Blumeria hordei DH14]SZE99557.1 unnamed protein product [Blumeria hordei]
MSEDKIKGISLRTKGKTRLTISAPRQISEPLPVGAALRSANNPSFQPSSQRLQVGGKTSDLVKRRYSTRFNNIPADYDPTRPPLPNVPPIPGRFSPSERGRKFNDESRGRLNIDVAALRDPNLRPDQYISGLLGDASEQDIDSYQNSLRDLKKKAATDLQQNLYQNRTQFIKISKEADKLKGEMRALKNLMSELKTNTTALRAATIHASYGTELDGFPTQMSKRNKRSSVADRSALWNSQLQAMWKMIEGSQKFLPAIPGRHPILDAGLWIELDNATWKPRRMVQIVLLNDNLLVAARKKRRVEGNGSDQRQAVTKIVAERCWPLLDIEIVDLAGTAEASGGANKLSDAIMIRGVGSETYTYRTEKADGMEKQSLVMSFKKQLEELRKGLRSEMETTNRAKETINYFAARDPGLLKKTGLLETLSDIKDTLIEVDGKQQNLRWVETQVDELDINIALQRFDAAVLQVEQLTTLAKGLKSNTIVQEFISYKASERATKLAGLITSELLETHNEPKKTKCNICWLARLGFEDRAREVYLEARGNIIHQRSRQCIFEGNLFQYIWEISFIYFTIIRNTVSTYQACFPSPLMSACVKWAKEQVESFSLMLERQLSNTERNGPVWTECMAQAKQHANMLSEVGLDIKGLISRNTDHSSGISEFFLAS